ncbi:exosortase A [Sphingomonas sp. PAMC26645]|uniref:exosortase A n=1 Tax=Sphingomonas sp. PAMC26645 TaxID=2565555 RepID=UPI00109E06FC|nr:exosortase A [Sphingomonas sp. PAMC26645]QCB43351.1 exosortase A [Sphingomonas sp. PAMC26645]
MTVWRRHGIALAVVAALILLTFRSDVADLAHIWWTSTTFGHCLFIGPVIAWLVWQRRAELAQLTPTGWWPGLALIAIGGGGWLMGDAASVGFARQLGLVMMLQGAVVTILGPNVARGLLFPLAYAFFLVPFGEGLEPPLQTVTVAIVMPLLHLVGVPAVVDGVLIHAGRYYFEVAEACSGAKFVIAMFAFGVLVANLCFVSWRRRAVFLVVSVVVPVIANGFRAFGTIWAADLTSVEAATGIDHIVYGWVFFALVMAGVMAIGWRWFDRGPDDPAFDPAKLQATPRNRTDLAIATALALTTFAVFPAWSAAIAGRAQPLPAHIDLPEIAGWHRVPVSTRAPWTPYYPGADHYLFGRYADATGARVDMSVAVFGSQHEGKELIAYGTGVLREEDRWVRVADLPEIAGGSVMRITAPGPVERIVATWYRVGDTTTQDETLVKIETMKARLLGGPQGAVAIHLSVEGADARPIARFLAALGPIAPVADHAAGMR